MTHDPTNVLPVEWRARFDALIHERTSMPFQWGVHDCCLFAADAVLAVTGVDYAAHLRGTYTDARSAVEVLAANGGLEGVAAPVGPECPPLCARLGDVGLVNDGERDALGVCLGDAWATTGKDGIGLLPLDAAKKAWRVYA